MADPGGRAGTQLRAMPSGKAKCFDSAGGVPVSYTHLNSVDDARDEQHQKIEGREFGKQVLFQGVPP